MRFILALILGLATTTYAQTAAGDKAFDFQDPKDNTSSLGHILGSGDFHSGRHIQLSNGNEIRFFDANTKIYETSGLNLDSGVASRPIIFRIGGNEAAQVVDTSSATFRLTNRDASASRYADITVLNNLGGEAELDFGLNNGGGVTTLLKMVGNANTVHIGPEATRSTFTAAGGLFVPTEMGVATDSVSSGIKLHVAGKILATDTYEMESTAGQTRMYRDTGISGIGFDAGAARVFQVKDTGEMNIGLEATRSTFTAAGNLEVGAAVTLINGQSYNIENAGGSAKSVVRMNADGTTDLGNDNASDQIKLGLSGEVNLGAEATRSTFTAAGNLQLPADIVMANGNITMGKTIARRLYLYNTASNDQAYLTTDVTGAVDIVLGSATTPESGLKIQNNRSVNIGPEAVRSTFTSTGNLELGGTSITFDKSEALFNEILVTGAELHLIGDDDVVVRTANGSVRSTFTAVGNLDLAADLIVGGGDIITTNSTLDIDAGGASSLLRLRTNSLTAITVDSSQNVLASGGITANGGSAADGTIGIVATGSFGAWLKLSESGTKQYFFGLDNGNSILKIRENTNTGNTIATFGTTENTSLLPYSIEYDDGLTAGEHQLLEVSRAGSGGVLLGYIGTGAAVSGGYVRAPAGHDLAVGSGLNVSTFTTAGNLQVPGDVSADSIAIGDSTPAFALDIEKAGGGAEIASRLYNTANASGDNARQIVQVGGTSGGDPFTQYTVSNGFSWSVGVDNSDTDKFKVSYAGVSVDPVPGTNDMLVMDSSGNTTITGSVTVGSFVGLDSVTKATLEGTQPTAVGQVYYCSDCLNAVHVVVSTGTTANGQFDSFTGGTAWH
jgi:hypothetical protein